MLYANCDKFISYVGGGGIISSYFGGTNIMWTSRGKEVREGYLDEDSNIIKNNKEKIKKYIYSQFLSANQNT